MKFSCPQCFSEFSVPDAAFGGVAKRVRCANCAHVWFQEPDNTPESLSPEPLSEAIVALTQTVGKTPDPVVEYADDEVEDEPQNTQTSPAQKPFSRFDDGMDFEPIPPSLHPDEPPLSHAPTPMSAHVRAYVTHLKAKLNASYLARFSAGIVFACAAFALLLWFGALAGLHEGTLKRFYTPFGIGTAGSAAGALAIEDATAEVLTDDQGHDYTKVTGKIRNIGEHAVQIPLFEISIITASGAQSDSRYIKLELERLAPGQTVAFDADLPSAISAQEELRVRFIN